MVSIRNVDGYSLNVGELAAKGLYNISKGENSEELSIWFEEQTKNELMAMSDNDYVNTCKLILTNS